MSDKIRLKPVLFKNESYRYEKGRQNTTEQMFLLKALKITSDPKKLRDIMGVKTVAQVYRTLDKLAMRKEYHSALARSGISFDFIVEGLKAETGGGRAVDRIKAFQILLKSLGLDKYDSDNGVGSTWEEELVKSLEKAKVKELEAPKKEMLEVLEADTYEVKTPEVPESMRKMREEEDKLFKGIYD